MANPLDDYIVAAVRAAGRNYQRGVLPRMVQPLLPVTLSEQRVRLYMVRLWQEGKLVRIDADASRLSRRGYRVPNQAEMRLEQDLLALLDRKTFGVRECELARELARSEDLLAEYLLQMEAAGRVVRRWGDVRLPTKPELVFFEKQKFLQVG